MSFMAKWRNWTRFRGHDHAVVPSEHEELLRQIREAHLDWTCAQGRLDVVVDHDEVDYAIFALEAAEKRYGILIKQAKAMKVSGSRVYSLTQTLPHRTLEG